MLLSIVLRSTGSIKYMSPFYCLKNMYNCKLLKCQILILLNHFIIGLVCDLSARVTMKFYCGSAVVSKHGLYVGGLCSIPTTITTMTAAGGDAEHVSLNH